MLGNLFTFNFNNKKNNKNMNNNKINKNLKFFLKVSIFLILLIPSIVFIGKKYATASTENIINLYNQKRFDEFYNLPKNSLDLVFLGSSHSYCTFDPEIFDERLKIKSYQLGMPLQHPDSTYYTLKEVLNYHLPKAVVMEVYWGVLENDFELNQIKTLFQVLKNEKLKNEYIKETFPLEEKLKYKTNIFKFQSDYFAFKGNEIKNRVKNKFNLVDKTNEKQEGEEYYRSKGYTLATYKMLESEFDETNQFKNLDGKNWVMSLTQKNYLQKIIELCKQNNIELIFVTAPVANVSMDFIKNYDNINNEIKKIANENDIYYIDYNLVNSSENLLSNENFRDDAHLNHSGAEIVSNHFSTILKSLSKY